MPPFCQAKIVFYPFASVKKACAEYYWHRPKMDLNILIVNIHFTAVAPAGHDKA